MRLASFRIKNFKSIQDTGICHCATDDNILVLAGQNEAGKSAIIEALDFFGNGPSADFEKLHRRKEEDPEVICRFVINSEEIKEIFQLSENAPLNDFLLRAKEIELIRCISIDGDFENIFFSDEFEEKLDPVFGIEENLITDSASKTPEEGQAADENEPVESIDTPTDRNSNNKELARTIHGTRPIRSRRARSAGLTAVLATGFHSGLEVDVRGSFGGSGRLDHGPWAARLPVMAMRTLR